MLAMDVWCFSKSTIRVDLEKHQTRLHYWGNSLCNFEESPLQLWGILLYNKHSSIFCSLFVSTDYNDGTIRNKVIAGSRRAEIYIANLIVNIVASFLLCFSYILANIVIGVPLIGTLETPLPKALLILAGSLLTVVAFCAVFTMISLLIQSKAIAPVVCIVAMFLSIAFLNEVQRILDQPEFWYDGTVNTAYVDGTEREVLEFLYNAIPAGQEMQYSRRSTENIGEMAAYAAGLTVITTGIGAFFFNRKDIR